VRPPEAVKAEVVEKPLDSRFLVLSASPDDSAVVLALLPWLVAAIIVGLMMVSERKRASRDASANLTQLLAGLDRDVDGTLLRYLRNRFAVDLQEPTPSEIDRTLKRAGVSDAVRRGWIDWQKSRDSRRFSPTTQARSRIDSTEARRLILEAEAGACMRC
jgi:hypothetical protein